MGSCFSRLVYFAMAVLQLSQTKLLCEHLYWMLACEWEDRVTIMSNFNNNLH